MSNVVIIDAKRTPIGTFAGALSGYTAPELASAAIFELIKRTGCKPGSIEEVILGHVLSAGCGQAPARQAALKAGLPDSTPCYTVNRVCSSGMTAVMSGADQIRLGRLKSVIAGGMESMSRVPFYLQRGPDGNRPTGPGPEKTGTEKDAPNSHHSMNSDPWSDAAIEDGILTDGLRDAFHKTHMGLAAENCARRYNISRQQQDDYAVQSYQRAIKAAEDGLFDDEIIRMKATHATKPATVIDRDEGPNKFKPEKIPVLKPVFDKNGTITAANASQVSDGAAALLLMDETHAVSLGLQPMARILGYAARSQEPEYYPTAPVPAIEAALEMSGLSTSPIDLYEINEAFAVVAIVNSRLLNLDMAKVNIHGGAVSMGHPLGCSGTRILVTLLHSLYSIGGRYGCAAICNGGGGASALVIERIGS